MDKCLVKCINEKKVNAVAENMPDSETIKGISELFKALSDPGRLMIVTALLEEELCVCDIAAVTGVSESTASHRLRILRHLNIVKNRREGKILYYSLDDEHVGSLLENTLIHYQHTLKTPE